MGLIEDINAIESGYQLDAEQLGEAVVYRRYQGTPRTVQAIVNRQPPAKTLPLEVAKLSPILVAVQNDSIRGIAADCLTLKQDSIGVADYPGGELVIRPIHSVISVSGGIITVALVR